MRTIEIDQHYYTNTDHAYKPLMDAFQDVGPAPCTVYNCPRQSACAEEKVDCKSFRFWVNNGKMNEKGLQKILKKL